MILIAAAGLLGSIAMAQTANPKYSVLDLGVVGGAPGQPYFIANDGLIAGASGTANNKTHAAVWFMGLEFDLATPGLGGPNSAAYGVNEKGQVVGIAETTVANSEDFCGFNALGVAKSLTACLPFVLQNGVMTKLPTLGGPNGIANSINNLGEAVGWAETVNNDPNAACRVLQFQPVMWGRAARRSSDFPGRSGWSRGVNQRQRAGGGRDGNVRDFQCQQRPVPAGKARHAVERRRGDQPRQSGRHGVGAGNHACAINNRGQVVGHSDLTGDTTFHTFLWTWETGMKDIGTLPGDVASMGMAVSDQGIIVGVSLDQNFNPRAFV